MTVTAQLSVDELLTTTRAVRRKLDFDRPVPRAVLHECFELALQAPTASNLALAGFLVVESAGRRRALAEIYRRAVEIYRQDPASAGNTPTGDPVRDATQRRVRRSVEHLAEHLHRVPALVVPCLLAPTDGTRATEATFLASVIPAAWSFCLAARSRGLGTAWTTLHLLFEREAADILDIPYDTVRQLALIPVAHTTATRFGRAARPSVDSVVSFR